MLQESTNLEPGDRMSFLGSNPHHYASSGGRVPALLLLEYTGRENP
jgi:hypothetical protein